VLKPEARPIVEQEAIRVA
jgi:uncharacterized protein with HEPN domain